MTRCPSCDPACRCILGDGPIPCELLFIGEKPGQEEAYRGRVFIGDTGQEVNNLYLPLLGVDRGEVRITNAVKCRLGSNNNKPSPAQVAECAGHWLPGEVRACRPSIIVLLGATACSLVPKIELDKEHGFPVWCNAEDSAYFGGWEGWVVPMYHPAAALHETGMMVPLLEDFERIGKWLRGRWSPPEPAQEHDYDLVRSRQQLVDDLVFRGCRYRSLPVDTENDGPAPWSLQYSLRSGHGRLIRADRKELIALFWELAEGWDGFLLHNAPHDLDVLDRMGIHVTRYRDTMQEAYQLGNLPQGLKALAYRLLGVRMRSWEDLVMPYSRAKMCTWLLEQWDEASDNRVKVETQLKTKVKVAWKPTQRERDLKRILSHSHKPEYNLWEKAQEAGMEGYPIPSIAHVPLEEAVDYGCLSRESRVQTESGLRAIGDLVRDRYSGRVLSIDPRSEIPVLKRVVGWHRVEHAERVEWFSVVTDLTRIGRWDTVGTRYTGDHRLLTPSGWCPVQDLKVGDQLYFPQEELDSVQAQVLYGNLLGDGSIAHRNKKGWAGLTVSHCARQLPYLKWQAGLLRELSTGVRKAGHARPRKIDARWANSTQFYRLCTCCHPQIYRTRLESYPQDGKGKRVGSWLSKLDALGLAIWLQDDGTILRNGLRGQPRFYTNGFPKSDVESICDMLNDKFGLEPNMFTMAGQWVVSLWGHSCETFYDLVCPFVHPCLQYKLPPAWRGRFVPDPPRERNGLVVARVRSVLKHPMIGRRGSLRTSYCLDVEDTHCFCTQGQIAHNCRDADMTGQVGAVLERLRREIVAEGGEWAIEEGDEDQ